MTRHPMTKEGELLLREELRKLKSKDRKEVVKAIAEARELGDLKENAEYHAAKEQQGLIERRVREVEAKLADAQVIDVQSIEESGKAIFEATHGTAPKYAGLDKVNPSSVILSGGGLSAGPAEKGPVRNSAHR